MGETTMALDMPSSATKLTYDDFVLFPDDGNRHELVDGSLLEPERLRNETGEQY
jgi:hypothetical protein